MVTGLLEGKMVNVYLPLSEMEIPAFEDDLVRADEFLRHPVKAKMVEGKKEAPQPVPPPLSIQTQYTILKGNGIQIAFEAVLSREGLTDKYLIFLLNDTKYDVVYTIQFQANHRRPILLEGNLKNLSFVQLGEMPYDDLNEAPGFEVECRWISTEGLGEPVSKFLKIKPKTFFGSVKTAPLLNRQVFLFKLFEKPVPDEEAQGEDLATYTKRNAKAAQKITSLHAYLSVNDTKELAEFEPEVDLHIEKLTDRWHKMSNSEIIRLQIVHFEAFINKAIRLGVPRVFIIHGVGEGRLRDEVATRLMQYPEVQTFKNEYHHRYGWGATEVIF